MDAQTVIHHRPIRPVLGDYISAVSMNVQEEVHQTMALRMGGRSAGIGSTSLPDHRFPVQLALDGKTASCTSGRFRETALAGGGSVGQVFTPPEVAELMASWVDVTSSDVIRILDPGAGEGVLSIKLVERLAPLRPTARFVVEAYELDESLAQVASTAFGKLAAKLAQEETELSFTLHSSDYLAKWTDGPLLDAHSEPFDIVIQNPPYAKLRKASGQSRAAGKLVHGQPNIYALFLAKAAQQLRPGGQMVAIAPRSWLSGSYFERMRVDFLRRMTLDRIHAFRNRGEVFGKDSVLQETIILHARRSSETPRPHVELSVSEGLHDLHEPLVFTLPWSFMSPAGPQYPIRLPETITQVAALRELDKHRHSLVRLGLSVSTGPVVGFRAVQYLRSTGKNGETCVPLLWISNVRKQGLSWGASPSDRQPPYLLQTRESTKMMTPGEELVLVRRFSAKEDRHRVIACRVREGELGPLVAIENHLNVLRGFTGPRKDELAEAVCNFLNSGLVDEYVRAVSGTTQVNAYDLASLPFPDRDTLLSEWRDSEEGRTWAGAS